MSWIVRISAAAIMLSVVVPAWAVSQSPPDLSGNWVLASATTSATRDTGEAESPNAAAERPTTSYTASGAAFNCGRQCTIVQKGQALTIEKALLTSKAEPAPAVTLQVNGRQTVVADSFSRGRTIPVTAMWRDDKLQITSSSGSYTHSQAVSIQAGQLVVVTTVAGSRAGRVTFRYDRKK